MKPLGKEHWLRVAQSYFILWHVMSEPYAGRAMHCSWYALLLGESGA